MDARPCCRVLLWLAVIVAGTGSAHTLICHVTAGGSGRSSAATMDFQTASPELPMAAGVHKPTATGNQAIGFKVHADVETCGGFAETETARDPRNPGANVVLLSGDIDGNDSDTDGTFFDETVADIASDDSALTPVVVDTNARGEFTIATRV